MPANGREVFYFQGPKIESRHEEPAGHYEKVRTHESSISYQDKLTSNAKAIVISKDEAEEMGLQNFSWIFWILLFQYKMYRTGISTIRFKFNLNEMAPFI